MAGPRTSRKPTFFWQGMLILLPVAVLAAIGWASLRQDKILAEHDARERAQTIADDFLQKFSTELTATRVHRQTPHFLSWCDPAGQSDFPHPVRIRCQNRSRSIYRNSTTSKRGSG